MSIPEEIEFTEMDFLMAKLIGKDPLLYKYTGEFLNGSPVKVPRSYESWKESRIANAKIFAPMKKWALDHTRNR
jgi:hypothetical protein